jgi:hypothetical protein
VRISFCKAERRLRKLNQPKPLIRIQGKESSQYGKVTQQIRECKRHISAINKKMSRITARVSALASEMREQRRLLWEIREMWEDRLLLNRPMTPSLADAILWRRYPIYRQEEICVWESVLIKWRDANELRALLRAAPVVVRERLFALLSCVNERDCLQHVLEHHPLTTDQQRLLDILKAAWSRENALQELLRNGGVRIVERFVALVRLDVTAGERLVDAPNFVWGAERSPAEK